MIKDSLLVINNNLPNKWKKLSIRIKFQGRLIKITYLHAKTVIDILDGEPLNVIVDGIKKNIK